MRSLVFGTAVLALTLVGCSKHAPTQPQSASSPDKTTATRAPQGTIRSMASGPGYEPAYVGGRTVMINAIDVPNHAPRTAQADFYEVTYPNGWQQLGLAPPQCNPCDHGGDGIDPTDFHDHILDSMPGAPGHGEFSPLWHVFVVVPVYTGDATHDTAVSAAYAAHLPTKSEAAVDALLDERDASGAPIAIEIDTHFYFLCAVVSPHAAH